VVQDVIYVIRSGRKYKRVILREVEIRQQNTLTNDENQELQRLHNTITE
jgi:hypothetical protein